MDLKAAMAHTRKSMDPVFGHVFIYEHCLPFDVTRAYDEASGIKNPRIWDCRARHGDVEGPSGLKSNWGQININFQSKGSKAKGGRQ